MWTQLRGKDPQSTQEIDRWDCGLAFLPMLLVENSQRQMQTAAAINEMTSEVKKTDVAASASVSTVITLLNRALDVPRPHLPSGGNGQQLKLLE